MATPHASEGLNNHRALLLLGVPLLLGGVLAACSSQPAAQRTDKRPSVVATSSLLCDLTRQLAGESVQLTCLIQPGQDPHTYVPTPGDRQAIDQAQLLLYSGYGFDESLSSLVKAAQGKVRAVPVSELAVPKPLMGGEHHHTGAAEGAAEHNHEATEADNTGPNTPDPHVWNDARNGVALVQVIARKLSQINPSEQARYSRNSQQLSRQLTALDGWIRQQVATIPTPNRKLVSTHDALSYYGNAYGLEIAGALQGRSSQNQPSPQRLASLIEEIRAARVPTVFVENTTNPKLIETVAREAAVKVSTQPLYVEGPGGAQTPATDYQHMLVENTCTLVEGLGGRCDRPKAPLR